ncbi:MAG: class I SAM-dependent methyltransferase [Candidatus Odinarchaeia archaeon]
MEEDWEAQWNRLWARVPLWWMILLRGYRRLLKGLNLNGVKIVELGSGSGRTSLALAKELNGEVTLIDNSPSAIRLAYETFKHENVPFKIINADIFNLKLDEKFDIAHSEGLIEHFDGEKLNKIIQIHADLVKKEGFVIIFVPTPSRTYKLWRRIQEHLNMWYYGDEKPFTVHRLLHYLRRNNLKPLRLVFTPFQLGVLSIKK